MSEKDQIASVFCDGLSKSVRFELSRLCEPQITLRATIDRPAQGGHLATLRPWSAECDEATVVPFSRRAAAIVFSDDVRGGRQFIFDVSEPRSMLAMLARLCTILALNRRSVTAPTWLHSQLHEHVAQIMCGLDLHLTERSLARRLNVAPSTLRRWFTAEGVVHCGRFLVCIRGFAALQHFGRGADSTARIAEILGFEHVESFRRMLRNFSVDTIALRREDGHIRLEKLIRAEIEGEQKDA